MKRITHRDFFESEKSIEIILNGGNDVEEIKNETFKFIRRLNKARKVEGLPNYAYRIEARAESIK